MSELVKRSVQGHVVTLSLNAVGRRNALSLELREALDRLLSDAMTDGSCRVIVLTGEGGHFCAGGDISGMKDITAVSGRQRLVTGHRIVRTIVEGDKPVIAAVEGFAVGAGLSLAAACDIVVAAKSAKFACSFNRLGLVADFGLAFTLPHRVGMGRARQIMLTGDTFTAETAEGWGLVEILTDEGQALASANDLAHRMSQETAPLSNAYSKRLLSRMPGSLDDILMAEADSQSVLYVSEDFAEGRAAFLGKRKPSFQGR